MKQCIIAISSVNHAIRCEKIIKSNGYYARITKLQPQSTQKGCAYGLAVNCNDLPFVLSLMNSNGCFYSEILK